jgi:hypothetical protein
VTTSTSILIPLADIGEVFGAIIIVVGVLGWIVSQIAEARGSGGSSTGTGTTVPPGRRGKTPLDERIRRRQEERKQRAEMLRHRKAAEREARRRKAQGLPEPVIMTDAHRQAEEAAAEARREAERLRRRRERAIRARERAQLEAEALGRDPAPQPVRVPQPVVVRSPQPTAKPNPFATGDVSRSDVTKQRQDREDRRRSSRSSARRLRKLLRDRDSVKSILVASEVLGTPIGLRPPGQVRL